MEEGNIAEQQTPKGERRKYTRGAGLAMLEKVPLPAGLDELVDVKQAMKALGLRSPNSIYVLINRKKLTPVKVLGSTKFPVSQIRALQGAS